MKGKQIHKFIQAFKRFHKYMMFIEQERIKGMIHSGWGKF